MMAGVRNSAGGDYMVPPLPKSIRRPLAVNSKATQRDVRMATAAKHLHLPLTQALFNAVPKEL